MAKKTDGSLESEQVEEIIEDEDVFDDTNVDWEDEEASKNHWSFEGTQSWAWGASLILLGLLFLLDNFGFTNVRTYNWWAVFILAPGLSMLSRAISLYTERKIMTRGVSRNGVFGLVLILVSFSFLFGIGFGFIWPILLISVGIYLLFGNR